MFNKNLTLFMLGGLLLSFLLNPSMVDASKRGKYVNWMLMGWEVLRL